MKRIFEFITKIMDADPIDVVVWFFISIISLSIFLMGLKMFVTAMGGTNG
jgi:hypothetical protein